MQETKYRIVWTILSRIRERIKISDQGSIKHKTQERVGKKNSREVSRVFKLK